MVLTTQLRESLAFGLKQAAHRALALIRHCHVVPRIRAMLGQ